MHHFPKWCIIVPSSRGEFSGFPFFCPFSPFLLSGLFVRIELPGSNGGMALYPDFPLLFAVLCISVAFIGEIETEIKKPLLHGCVYFYVAAVLCWWYLVENVA